MFAQGNNYSVITFLEKVISYITFIQLIWGKQFAENAERYYVINITDELRGSAVEDLGAGDAQSLWSRLPALRHSELARKSL
jgi:hypothetical protein